MSAAGFIHRASQGATYAKAGVHTFWYTREVSRAFVQERDEYRAMHESFVLYRIPYLRACVQGRQRGKTFTQAPGTTLLLLPGELYVSSRAPEEADLMILFVPPAIFAGVGLDATAAPTVTTETRVARAMRSLEILEQSSHSVVEWDAAVLRILHAVRDVTGAPDRDEMGGARAPTHIHRARALLHERVTDDVTLDDLVREVGCSREHLVRAFQAQYGEPPHRYLMHLRVARARILLKRGMSATEVAFACGFYDQSHLNRWFKKVVGVTPGQYARAVV